MENHREFGTSRKRQRRRFRRLRFRLVCSLVFCLAAGCESGFGAREQGDPFLGIHAPPKPVTEPIAPNNAVAQATSGPIPPMPSSYTAPSTAPVAGGESATPENPRALRIGGDTASPTSMSSAGAVRGTAPGVTVGNPELAPAASTANSAKPAPPPPPSGGSAANIRSYEEAQQFLKQHGVTWQRMSGDGDEWKFSCGIPNPSNPHVNKTYQTNRPFPDLLSAMRAVIAQIEQTPH